jgi:hypothetical protein
MKLLSSILIFLLVKNFIVAQGDKVYASKNNRYQFYSDFVKKYNSESIQEIWKADKDKIFDDYVDEHNEKELVISWSTIIHELLHSYNESTSKGHVYFIEKGTKIEVPFTEVYNSKELNKIVRKGLQDSIFRYHLYIGGKSEILGLGKVKGINDSKQNEAMSIQKGVYGLLEEFSAYYYGNLAAYEQKAYYLKTYGENNKDAWQDYKHEVESDAIAYHEFQLFIALYMQLAKKKFPKVYEGIHKNQAFKVVYTLMSDKYESFLKLAESELSKIESEEHSNEILEKVNSSGSDEDFIAFLKEAGLEEDDIYRETTKVVNGKSIKVKEIILEKDEIAMMRAEYDKIVKEFKKAFGNNSQEETSLMNFHVNLEKQSTFLKKLLTPELEEELNKLKIKGVNTKNYKEFLK